jgi:endogenous inhibitor of DNA gyrase (YacG/DUF329 family)
VSEKEKQVLPLPQARRSKGGCPICRRPVSKTYRPFCSARCADIDLGRWLKGVYRVPTEEPAGPGVPGGGEEEEGEF